MAADKKDETMFGMPLKYVALLTLVVQNSMLVLIMKYSREGVAKSDLYLASTAVLVSEVTKLCVCFVLFLQEPQNKGAGVTQILSALFGKEAESWKMMVPAALYVIQNNLQYLAVSNLDPATFQVTYQMKILTTAVFSVLMLKKSLTLMKWIALVLLTVGIALVQMPTSSTPVVAKNGANSFVGLIAVTVACVLSGLAGVWFEKVLKGTQASVWHRNIQLSTFSIIPGLLGAFLIDGRTIAEKGFFHGYTFWAWMAIANQAFGGLIVALVVKYADNILKGFATSISIILSAIASIFLFDFFISLPFVIGAAVVLYATHLYGLPDAPAATLPAYQPAKTEEEN
ncbi:nucleotide-sugar transporter [Rhizoclosmatium globosum]|uniref:Nucleotide-sugar transporter n=1 Tax=Rhizoclosmatium globosum TaxID=329046 RepID=A0A1Y2CMP0_9FUNG|nr:nucleotide-sugar transporter [Rhizoclosmatium globosum]|eukprot:ORY48308.1 nucleotide-sugar transporter [Rhizoclosmatium globosum]